MTPLLTILRSPQALWIVFGLTIGIWLSVSWILNYHWKSYGADMHTTKKARSIYFIGSGTLIFIIAILIISL